MADKLRYACAIVDNEGKLEMVLPSLVDGRKSTIFIQSCKENKSFEDFQKDISDIIRDVTRIKPDASLEDIRYFAEVGDYSVRNYDEMIDGYKWI
ncbi:MAG TPA: hypothetical protein VJB94_00725 [Candidatus Nanoarchaeia archaeon]|nr:hypothetical protein [Candidatus Nanoarchaeia archaeon]